ncbi:MAG: PKD domain-containing protein, partial [Bacteroidetes bacterium]|nr:PKD domain-containing protein [Bacteroidota bacterium]
MKLYLHILSMALLISFGAYAQKGVSEVLSQPIEHAQEGHRCSTDELHAEKYSTDPEYRIDFDAKKEAVSAFPLTARVSCDDPIIIPVAVHFEGVTNQTAQCLEDLVLSQLVILNEDYSSSNSDVSNYCDDAGNSSLDPLAIAANGTCIQFCLANQNHPSGFGLSNGDYAITINENYVANGSFPNFTNGTWAGYFNIFVTEGTGVLGYAPLYGDANGDGIVIEACVFGRQGSGCGNGIGPGGGCAGLSVYNLGRTATHEAGHYLGLPHIWGNGDESGQCGADDGFSDTPNAEGSTYGCPDQVASSCGVVDMTMNYMDYVNDACMYMFSEQQATTMYNYAATKWSTTSTKCSNTPSYPATLIPGGCNPDELIAEFTFEVQEECPARSVTFTNNSMNETNYLWHFGDGDSSMLENPVHTYPVAGIYTVTLTVGDGVDSDMTTEQVISGAEFFDNLNDGTLMNSGSADWGYIGGHNNYGDIAKAEYFDYLTIGNTLSGANFLFAATGGNPSTSITLNIWDNDGLNGFPGSIISTTNLTISQLNLGAFTFVDFPDVIIDGPLYIGFELNYIGVSTTENSISVATNSDGETVPTTAYEQWSDNDWYSFNDGTGTETTWELDVSLAISAILDCVDETGDPPVTEFSADDTTVCDGTEVNFTDESTNAPTSWLWDFGDGNDSELQHPSHTYAGPGMYTITLTATNEEGFDDEVKVDYIDVQAQPTGFEGVASDDDICVGDMVNLSMTGTFGGAYSWETSTGAVISNNSTAVVSPTETSTYTAICDNGICRTEDEVTITVNNPPAEGTFNYLGCTGDGYSIEVNGTNYNESNASGVEVIENGAINGCDSTINIELDYAPHAISSFTYTGCSGDGFSVTVNEVVYNEANTTGQEVIFGGGFNGCDSTINVSLNFEPNSTGLFSNTSCEESGYSIMVGGTTFNEANPDGVITLSGSAS